MANYLSDADTQMRQGLKHTCNEILKSIAEERSAPELLVFFPKCIKSLLLQQIPKVKKVPIHLKWRALSKALKKYYSERKNVCRNSLKWLMTNNFRSHVTIRSA